jgi:hypothetical protein
VKEIEDKLRIMTRKKESLTVGAVCITKILEKAWELKHEYLLLKTS